MDVITTHVNADFDCLGAMVAAGKLYPGALMVFAGSQEKSMRDFFLKSTSYVLNFTRLKDLDLSLVTRLIVVDCQHSSRIGRFAEILKKPGVKVYVYDHHPESSGDIKPGGGVIRECGSSTAILTLMLAERGIEVNPIEATLMMLGVYEDTGSLIFPSTTVDDYRAAAWLLSRGANLNTVSDFITQELTAEQVSLLNDLLKSLKSTDLNGVQVSIAHASVDHYIGDIAVLAHMMRDMENLQALFIVVGMGSRVYIVARSRIPEVNVGEILQDFGGGGHATAASATVKELTLLQVLAKLEQTLRDRVNPRRVARDIMSAPVKTLPVTTTIADAGELLTRYNVNAMPVVDEGPDDRHNFPEHRRKGPLSRPGWGAGERVHAHRILAGHAGDSDCRGPGIHSRSRPPAHAGIRSRHGDRHHYPHQSAPLHVCGRGALRPGPGQPAGPQP